VTDLNTSLNCSLFSTFSMRKPNEPRGLLSLRRTSLQTFDLWDVDQPLEFSFWFAICFFNDAKVPPFIFCNCCLLVDSFLCWLKFFLQACCLPQNVFLCLVSLERGGFFVFWNFLFLWACCIPNNNIFVYFQSTFRMRSFLLCFNVNDKNISSSDFFIEFYNVIWFHHLLHSCGIVCEALVCVWKLMFQAT